MSADTHALECPECSWEVLPSEAGLWAEDRAPEHCVGCGALVRVLLDDGDPERAVARAALVERGGVVVARLLAVVEQAAYEADYTPPPGKVSDVARASITAAMAAEGSSCIEAGCIPAHTASEVLDAHDDANVEVERLTEDETERVQDARHAMRLARIDRAGLQTEAAHFKAQSKAAHADAVASANLSTAIANRRDTYKKERDKALGVVERLTAERDKARRMFCVETTATGSAPEQQVAVAHGWLGLFDGGTPTGATPKTSMTGPEYVAAVRESGLTPEDVEGIRGGVRRHRGVDAFFGTHSADYGAGYSAYMNGDMPGLGAIAAEWNAGYNDAKKNHDGEPGGES